MSLALTVQHTFFNSKTEPGSTWLLQTGMKETHPHPLGLPCAPSSKLCSEIKTMCITSAPACVPALRVLCEPGGRCKRCWGKTWNCPATLMGSLLMALSCWPELRRRLQLLPFRQTYLQSCYCFPQVTNATGWSQLSHPGAQLLPCHQVRRVLCFNCHICCLERCSLSVAFLG